VSTYCDAAIGHPWHGPYHDHEYGFPLAGDAELFERLTLEINQAGLSWLTILRKREAFRRAFDDFDIDTVAAYDAADRTRLLNDAGIVRNRLKVDAAVQNAQAYLDLSEKQSFASFLWDFVDGVPVQNGFKSLKDVPGSTDVSKAISKELKARGFRFVGPTTVYAMMQSAGMVNDHLTSCHRHDDCAGMKPEIR
jgi:DNA-3-methyladenine glycosylase I